MSSYTYFTQYKHTPWPAYSYQKEGSEIVQKAHAIRIKEINEAGFTLRELAVIAEKQKLASSRFPIVDELYQSNRQFILTFEDDTCGLWKLADMKRANVQVGDYLYRLVSSDGAMLGFAWHKSKELFDKEFTPIEKV
jgi:hypothetical protein